MTINDVIFTVCTTQFKKDAPDAFKALKTMGLEAFKADGRFYIYNKNTRKYLSIDTRRDYQYGRGYVTVYTVYGDYRFKTRGEWDKVKKFDFWGYITKPNNTAWGEVINRDTKPTRTKYGKIVNARQYLKWRKEEVEKIQNQIEVLQKQLINAVKREVAYENDLNNIRVELGLKRR